MPDVLSIQYNHVDYRWEPVKSTPSTSDPIAELPEVITLLKDRDARVVVDFGAGRGRHVPLLAKSFQRVIVVENERNLGHLRQVVDQLGMRNCSVVSWKEFKADRSIVADGIFLCCVMHTIPTLDLRRRAVAANLRRLREEGVVVVITPRHDSKYTTTAIANAVVFEDGIVRLYGDGTFTFYRNYTKSELIEFLGQVGLQPVEEIHSSHRIIVVAERKRRSRQGSL